MCFKWDRTGSPGWRLDVLTVLFTTMSFGPVILQTVTRPCSKTVYIGESTGLYSGRLNYTTTPTVPVSCVMDLQTDNDSVIYYKLPKVSLLPPPCSGGRCGCRNSLTIKSRHFGQTDIETYCSQSNLDTRNYIRTPGDNVEFNVTVGLKNYPVSVVINFYTAKVAAIGCGQEEVVCRQECVHKSLACDDERHIYCDAEDDVCSDIKSKDTIWATIGGVLAAVTGLAVVVFVTAKCWRSKDSLCRRLCCKQRHQASRSIHIDVFAIQFSHSNGAFSENGEPSYRAVYQPPPPYSSLPGAQGPDSNHDNEGEPPPSYEESIQTEEPESQ